MDNQPQANQKVKNVNPMRSISGSSCSYEQLSEASPIVTQHSVNQFQEDPENDRRNLNIKIKMPPSPSKKMSINQSAEIKDELSKDEIEEMNIREEQLKQMELELEEQHRKNREMINAMKAEEPAHGKIRGDTPNWRKKKVRRHALADKKGTKKKDDSSENGSELPGEDQEGPEGEAKKPSKRNKKIQDQLKENGASIPVTTQKTVKLENNFQMFQYLIYDGYRPLNLQHTREYIDFLIRENLDDKSSLKAEATPQHILRYLEQTIRTKLPSVINEEEILEFDQNFECGNLDSVYLQNQYEYNMLMKVDTNTKGNTYWFNFKVSEFKVGQKYKFNIVNFTRNVEKFYNAGMNICTKSEAKGSKKLIHEDDDESYQFPTVQDIQDDADSPKWEYNLCTNIQFTEKSEIPRFIRQNKETGEIIYARYFSKLSFSYTFRDQDRGKAVTFAYSVPYGYTDLLKDLDEIKLNLMGSDQVENYVAMDKKAELELNEEENPKRPESNILPDGKKQGEGYDSDDYYLGAPPPKPQAIQGGQGQGASNVDQAQPPKSRLHQDISQKPDMRVVVNSKNAFKVAEDMQGPKSYGNKKAENQKLSQYEIQHLNIKREAVELKQVNQFERKFFEGQNDDNRDMSQFKNNQKNLEKRNKFRDQNFDIHLKTLLYRQEVIGQSICGLNIYQLTLTKKKEFSIKYKKKKVMYIQARLHAAETHGSLIMRKIMLEFTKNHEKYDKIFHNYIIKIIPMINPDGVVIGNSRCSLAGLDLNRRWSEPNPIMHPEIFYIKSNMKLVEKQSGGISMFCDLHGHNKQMNAFIYGCNKAPNEGLLSWTKTRLLPKILASIEPIFEFNKCVFSQEKFKYNTARVVVWNEFKVTNSFTLETSMFGKKLKTMIEKNNQLQKMKMVTSQLTLADFDSIGISILNSLLTYTQLEIQLEKEYKSTGGWLKKKKMDSITGETARQKKEQEHILRLHMERAQTKKLLTLQKSQITPAGADHKFQRSQLALQKSQIPTDSQDPKQNQDNSGKGSRHVKYQIQTKNLKTQNSDFQKEPQSAGLQKPLKSFSPDKRNNNVKEKQDKQEFDKNGQVIRDKSVPKTTKAIKPKRKNTITNLTLVPQGLQSGDSIELLKGTQTKKLINAAQITIENTDQGQKSAKESVRGEQAANIQPTLGGKTSKISQNNQSQRKIINQSSFKAKKVMEADGTQHDSKITDDLTNSSLVQMNWMSFFEDNEFENALQESKKPIPKNPVYEKAAAESDSEPSCDNFDDEELVERFEPAATQDEPIILPNKAKLKEEIGKNQAELDDQQKRQIQKYVQQQKKQQEQAQQNQLIKDQEVVFEQQQTFKSINQNIDVVQKQNFKLSKRMDLLTQQITDQIIYEKQHQKKTINTLKEMQQVHQMPTHIVKEKQPHKYCQFEKALVAAGPDLGSPMPLIKQNTLDNSISSQKQQQSLNQQIRINHSIKNQQKYHHTSPQYSNMNTMQHEASVRSSLQAENYNYNPEVNQQQLKQTKQNIINQMFESTQSNQSQNPQRQFQQRMMDRNYSNQNSRNALPIFESIAPKSFERDYNYKEQQESQQIKTQNLEIQKLIKTLSPNRHMKKAPASLPQSQFSHQNLLSQSPKVTTQQNMINNYRLQNGNEIRPSPAQNMSSFSVLQEHQSSQHINLHTIGKEDHKNNSQQFKQQKSILNRSPQKNTVSSIRQKMQEEMLIQDGSISKKDSTSRMPNIRKPLEISDPLQLKRKYGNLSEFVSPQQSQNDESRGINRVNTDNSDDESQNYVMMNKKVSSSEMKRQIQENKDYQIQAKRFIGQRTIRASKNREKEMTDSSYSSSFIGDISPSIIGQNKRLSRNDPNQDPQLALKVFKINNSFDHHQQSDYSYSPEKQNIHVPTMRNHSYFQNNTKYKIKKDQRFFSPQKSDRDITQISPTLPPAIKVNSSPLSGQQSTRKMHQINQFPKKPEQKLILPQVISKPLGVELQSESAKNNWDYNQGKLKSPLARGPNPSGRKGGEYARTGDNSIVITKNKNQMI